MKQSFEALFLDEIRSWDKIHRLVGQKPAKTLWAESVQALKGFKGLQNLVDLGAGSGILGFPLLLLNPEAKVAFVEPDMKKAAFLIHFKTKLVALDPLYVQKVLVLPQKLQDVSRETLEDFFGDSNYVLAARAFSGELSLMGALAKSSLPRDKVYEFSAEGDSSTPTFVLKKI